MTQKRKPPSLSEKLAAALLHLDALRCQVDPALAACIERERAKQMTPKQIAQHYQWDHSPIPHAWDGSTHPTNLNPIPVKHHREKTAKKDVPVIAKAKRAGKKHALHQSAMQAKTAPEPPEPIMETVKPRWKDKWSKSAPMPGTKASGVKKSMSGKVSRRSSGRSES